jgi:hypothetical protein
MSTHRIFVCQKVLPDSEEILSELTETFHKSFLQEIRVTYILMKPSLQDQHTAEILSYTLTNK